MDDQPAVRAALIVACDTFTDARLQRLRAPARDAQQLAAVLSNPGIGNFNVDVSMNEDAQTVRRRLEKFFRNREEDDFLLLHFSTHGIKDLAGRLHFAATDTEKDLLASTAVAATWLNERMASTPSSRVVLFLDCCYSGAFLKGSAARSDDGIDLRAPFEGSGSAVITASTALEYAFEGDQERGEGRPSVFTSALVSGLETGDADTDGDGNVSVDELYEYVRKRVSRTTKDQTPSKWMSDIRGDLIVARSPRGPVIHPSELPVHVRKALAHPLVMNRLGAVDELSELLRGNDRSLAEAAKLRLEELANDDSRRVAAKAETVLRDAGLAAKASLPPKFPEGSTRSKPSTDQSTVHALASAHVRLLRGVSSLAKVFEATLGPRGRSVILVDQQGDHVEARDAATIARNVLLPSDQYERFGAQLAIECALDSYGQTGDGATAVSLFYALVEGGLKRIQDGVHPVQLTRGIEAAVAAVVENLKTQSRPVLDLSAVRMVARAASASVEIGDLIAQVMDKVGKDGVIVVEEGETLHHEIEYTEGMQFDRGYISPYFVTDADRMEAVLEYPAVLIADKKISSVQELLPALETAVQLGKPLFIVAEDVDGEANATLVVNKLKGTISVLAVKAPGFGDRRKEMLRDLAILTGATMISEELGSKLDSVTVEDFGGARRVVATRFDTTVVDGDGKPEEIKSRMMQIKKQIEESTSDNDREMLHERLAKLAGGVAVIKVGAPTHAAIQEERQRIEGALKMVKAAVEEGVVDGGGGALIRAGANWPAGDQPDLATGADVVRNALSRPFEASIANAGLDAAASLKLLQTGPSGSGIDMSTGALVDLREAGVLEVAKVLRVGLVTAAARAVTALAAELVDKAPSSPPAATTDNQNPEAADA